MSDPSHSEADAGVTRIDVANAVLGALWEVRPEALRDLREIPRVTKGDEDIEEPRLLFPSELELLMTYDTKKDMAPAVYSLATLVEEPPASGVVPLKSADQRVQQLSTNVASARRRRRRQSAATMHRKVRSHQASTFFVIDDEAAPETRRHVVVIVTPQVRQWAARLGLPSLDIGAAAVLLRRNWKRMPHEPLPLTTLHRFLERFANGPFRLPAAPQGRPVGSLNRLRQHAEWYVRAQILGESPTRIARAADVQRQSVAEGVRNVARYLSLDLQSRRKGRPAGKGTAP